MRSFRWLLLVAIVLIAAAVIVIFRGQRITQLSQRRAAPASVPVDTRSTAQAFEWGQSANGLPAVQVFAQHMKQSVDSTRMDLDQIELRIYRKDGLQYDRVKTGSAQLTTTDHRLYAPGEAEITLNVPVQGGVAHQLTSITTSGLNFDSQTGQAVTEKHVSFTFESGDGTSSGATYDPATHTLNLKNAVMVNLKGKGPHSKPMKIEAGQLVWNETTNGLLLFPWSRLSRDQLVVNAGQSTVNLKADEEGRRRVDSIDAASAQGSDTQPSRRIDYAADAMHVSYNDAGEMDKLTGTGNARLVSHGAGSLTTLTGDRVDLIFMDQDGESVLASATANGKGNLESRPAPDPKGNTADTRILKSDIVALQMAPGGKEVQRVRTEAPGTLEFQPNQAARHRRILTAERMVVSYGPDNQVESFHAASSSSLASTETYPSQEELKAKKPNLAISHTSSRTIDAAFDEDGELRQMKQTDEFHYAQGERKAQANTATLQSDGNVMELEKNARISDESGSTAAEHIRLDQTTGDFDAKGRVSTTRLPDNKKGESAMLDKDEPTLGTADRVTSANRNHVIHYIGNAVVWQTSNRIQADRIDIDRDKKMLTADGKVITEFEDSPRDGASESAAAKMPIFTIVKSQHLVYTDNDRLANYTGGVDFWRPTLTVKSASLRAYLNEKDSNADSRINHALGDGKVEIVRFAPDRQRVGNSEHAEYYTDDGKIILTGGTPRLDDSKKGSTSGDKLTYFTDDDRLVVEGAPERKAQTHIRRKS